MFLTGILQAFGALLTFAIFNIFIRVGSLVFDIQGILFACISILAASLALMVYSGPGKFGVDSIKNITTWVYGICNIMQFILDVYLSKYVSATELSLFSRLTVPLSLIMVFLLLKRKPTKVDLIGSLIILTGILMVFNIQDTVYLNTIGLLVIFMVIFYTGEFLSTEMHSQSSKANESGNLKDRARVIGFASFITSTMFLVVCFGASFIKDYSLIPMHNDIKDLIPSLSEYNHFPTVALGIFYGVVISSMMRFFLWSATYKIKTENVLAILVLVPFITYALEWLVSIAFGLDLNREMLSGERGQMVIFALAVMTLGSIISIIPKVFANVEKKSDENWLTAFKNSMEVQNNNYEISHDSIESNDYDIIEYSLNFFDNDYQKVADLYNISVDAVKVIKASRGNSCFIDEVSKQIHKVYQQKIAVKDKLTKANNRASFSISINNMIEKNESFKLIMLDLNDFKPVNDNYGHDAGDYVLKETVSRLENLYPDNVYRLGGDEFIVLTNDINTNLDHIRQAVSQNYSYKNHKLNISTSLGVSLYPEDAKSEDRLLEIADEMVYEDKKLKGIDR